MRRVLLYRGSLDVRSGAGQLIHMQAAGLRAAGERVRIACERGAARFFLRTGWRVRRLSRARARELSGLSGQVVIDHGMQLPEAHLVFVHGLASEGSRYQERDDWREAAAAEAAFFADLAPATPIVANSRLTRAALTRHFDIDPGRVRVCYPGYRSDRFHPRAAAVLRRRARRMLQLDERTPLVGFVTSGDFRTRGLDIFLESAERIARSRPETRFLVVGSKRLPGPAVAHPLVAAGRVRYRPKNARPELWMAALDIFLYASRFDAFGMVVAEAQALGVPVLTSRRVGASECLPEGYGPWVLDEPDSDAFASGALRLLADRRAREELIRAGRTHVTAFDQRRYARESLAAIRQACPP